MIIAQCQEDDDVGDKGIFRYFQNRFDEILKIDSKDRVGVYNKEWETIYTTYRILKEWYGDTFYYHHIGYILCAKIRSVVELIAMYQEMPKNEFKAQIKQLIKEKLCWNGVNDLGYGDNRIKSILLLHNIITMVKQNNERSRFPFDRYIQEEWDIEHIHARREGAPGTPKHRKEWLSGIAEFITEESLRKEAHEFTDFDNQSAFENLYNTIAKHFFDDEYDEGENLISNLALLDSKTNRGYGCSPFTQKRKTIIEKDKAGRFIPVCTRNVFQKYYSEEHPPKMTLWDEDDKNSYFEDITSTLKEYITQRTAKE